MSAYFAMTMLLITQRYLLILTINILAMQTG